MNALAECRDYDGLIAGLRVGFEKRDMPSEVLNEITGAPDRYFEKLFGPNPVRRLGMASIAWALQGLGLKLIVAEDPEAWAKIQARSKYKTRDKAHLQSVMLANSKQYVITARHLRKIQSLGGKARALKLTKSQRKKIARNAANARWAKVRGKEKLAAHRAASKEPVA